MSTQKVELDPRSTDRQYTRRERRSVAIKLAALSMVAAFVLAACSGSADTSAGGAAPADEQAAPATDANAVEVATGFIEAYSIADTDQAKDYLADGADVSNLPYGTLENPEHAWFQAMGYEQMLGICEVEGSSDLGTRVRCPYEYHSLRSEEVGNGPYSGSFFELTVKDGVIVRASEHFEFEANGFSAEMWEPFAKWVRKTYPKDVLVMYVDDTQTMGRLDQESLRLWEERSLEYANEVASS